MLGAWLSRTVTLCAHVAVLPQESVAVQVTVVTPWRNCAGASFPTDTPLPAASGVPSTTSVA